MEWSSNQKAEFYRVLHRIERAKQLMKIVSDTFAKPVNDYLEKENYFKHSRVCFTSNDIQADSQDVDELNQVLSTLDYETSYSNSFKNDDGRWWLSVELDSKEKEKDEQVETKETK